MDSWFHPGSSPRIVARWSPAPDSELQGSRLSSQHRHSCRSLSRLQRSSRCPRQPLILNGDDLDNQNCEGVDSIVENLNIQNLEPTNDQASRQRIFFTALYLLLIIGDAWAMRNFRIEKNSTIRELGYFWHVSDVFFDPTYSPLGAPEDDCHIKNPINFTRRCGFFGELGQCSSFGLVETIARAMNSTRWKITSPEFCIFTGNLRCPNPADGSDAIYETTNAFITDIQNAGFVNVYPSYGWYDYHPYGHHPLKLTTPYEKLKNLLREQKVSSSIFGQLASRTEYFSRIERPLNRIRVIVMNTNFYIKNHIASGLPDPAGQWKWLIDQLRGCRMADQKAFIVMSVPPGVHGDSYGKGGNRSDNLVWCDHHNKRYLRIIHKYHYLIAAQFAGHRHEDSFRLVYNGEGEAVSVILLAPAITPSFGNYPAMRIYMYDKNNGEILDFVQYYFNLTKANLEGDMTKPEKYWEVRYSFRDFYLLPDATTSSFEKLITNFRKNDVLFQRFYKNVKGFEHRKYVCERRCKLISLCFITTIDSGSFFECISGESIALERHVQQSQPPPEALRNRFIQRSINSVSISVSATPSCIMVDFFYVTIFPLVFIK